MGRLLGTEIPLYSGTHELAYLMSFLCKGGQNEHANFDTFYPHVGALYHKWTYKLWPKLTHDAPFMACVAAVKSSDSSEDFPIIIGASNHKASKAAIQREMQNHLLKLGYRHPQTASTDVHGAQQPHKNFANCAETWLWWLAK